MIDGCIGELSPFHETFGYYAHGIGPETAVLPAKWKTRLVRVTNVGKVPLPGLLPSDLGNGEPCLFIGWGFSRKENEDFAFQGNYPSNSSIAPGESREFTMKAWAEDPKMKFFRVGLWVSRKENTGFIGGPLRNRVAQRAEIPTTFRDNSRKSLLFAFVVCNAFFLIYLGFHFKNKRKTQVS